MEPLGGIYCQRCAKHELSYFRSVKGRSNFEFFCLAGGNTAPIGVKFGVDCGRVKGQVLHAKFYPHLCSTDSAGAAVSIWVKV